MTRPVDARTRPTRKANDVAGPAASRRMSSLDELLQYEQPKPVSHRQRSSRWLLKTALWSAIGALFGYGVLYAFTVRVPYALIFALLLSARVLRRVLRDLDVAPVPDTLRRAPARPQRSSSNWGEQDGLARAIAGWQTRLEWLHSRDDPRQFIRTVQPRLVKLIDERLRLRHGVTIAGDPQRASELLGEPLWTFVSQPVAKNPSPRALAALVAQMEEL